MVSLATKETARQKARAKLVEAWQPRLALSHREFAEKYVTLGAGPYKDHKFRVDRQPFIGLLFDAYDDSRWNEIFISGPSQSTKSLGGFVIPTLHDLVERRVDTLAGVPEADMMADKWDKDFLPVLQSSPALRWLIPSKGPGSKGGRIKDRITLGNGMDIKIMSRGGADTNKAGFSSPRVHLTEAAGWSKVPEKSVEGGSFRQLLARLRAFKRNDPRRLLTVEGTMTIKEELPYLARGEDDDDIFTSTRSRIVSPCPFCDAWICPERKFLVGWQDAENEQQVEENATWLCPECSAAIDDAKRAESLRDCRLVHYGQSVNKKGDVIGEPPPTSTLWFAWTAWHNLLLDASDIAIDEWEALQVEEGTQEKENAERALCQFTHGVPFESEWDNNEPINAKVIRKRTGDLPRNLCPPDMEKLTIGIDMGDWTGWWFAIAGTSSGVLCSPAYGALDIKRSKSDELHERIVRALHDFADNTVEQGFPVEGCDGLHIPDEVWIDGNDPDHTKAVAQFIRERGTFRDNRYKMVRGRGLSKKNGMYSPKKRVGQSVLRIGNNWYTEPNYPLKVPQTWTNSDYWKMWVHNRLRATKGSKGSLVFYRADLKNEHAKLTNHLANKQFKREWVPGKGWKELWVQTGDDHWLDAAAMASGALDAAGYSLGDIESIEQPEPPPNDESVFSRLLTC